MTPADGGTDGERSPRTARRRTVLAGVASGATLSAGGCVRRLRALAGWQSPRQVRLRIKTLPTDADPYALQLARSVAEWFRAAGIDAGVVTMTEEELLRGTLVHDEFELFVLQLPSRFRDPDALYALLHSRFVDAAGWQNPFGYANPDVDELLEAQRRSGGRDRRDALERLQVTLARTQPFTLLAVPDDIRAARTTAYTNWRSVDLRTPLGYLMLDRRTDADGDGPREDVTLRIAVTDHRPTENLNPLSVEFRRDGVLTGLLYDTLGRVVEGRPRPWLAESWEFPEVTPPVARVDVREGATWHDGEPLVAADVAFTYELLADTTLGTDTTNTDTDTDTSTSTDADDEGGPVPSPRFGGRSSLVDDVRVVDDTTAEIRFVDVHPIVAVRAFTVPILPEHVWKDRTGMASVEGVDLGRVTEALVTSNVPPVGSGPLRFLRNTPGEGLVLERSDQHFLNRDDGTETGGLPGLVGPVPFERLSVRVVGSDVAAIERVASGEADLTGTAVGAATAPRIGRGPELELLADRSDAPYVLGYNTRRPHLDSRRVRRTLARLIDSDHLVETVLDGYGRPAVGPLWGTRWYPESLAWSDGNPVTPFLGSDGEVDVERARAVFRDAGYRYDDGRLVEPNT